MVYCGKPSRGCQMCRTRRIKCDESKPTCTQCTKSRRECPGYKDEFDLVFRNETLATERRARRANRKALLHRKKPREKQEPSPGRLMILQDPDPPSALVAVDPGAITGVDETESLPSSYIASELWSLSSAAWSSSPSSFAVSVDGALSPCSDTPTLIRGPGVPLEQQASCHFVANFVLIAHQDGCSGFLDFVPSLLRDCTDTTASSLAKAFSACALAALGNRAQSRYLSDRANADYGAALAAVNRSMCDPGSVLSDATLASVLLLGLFENMTAKEAGTFAWGTHISGAVKLTERRGRGQLRTKTGLQLFIAVRTQMIISTLTSGEAPIMGVNWWLNEAVQNQTAGEVMRINIRTSELRAEVTLFMRERARTPASIGQIQDMIRRAYLIDGDCKIWMRDVPLPWQPCTVAWQEDHVSATGDYASTDVFPGRVDYYADFWTASVWNLARAARIVLASIVVRCAAWACSPVDYRTTADYAIASQTCVDMISDIIASVPHHLGWRLPYDQPADFLCDPDVAERRSGNANNCDFSSFACGHEDVQKMLAGYFLVWPLALVYGQDNTTDAQRQWVYGRLKYIADGLGIKSAHIVTTLNVRLPSMLIRRDGLLAQPYPQAHDFQKLVCAAPSSHPTTRAARGHTA